MALELLGEELVWKKCSVCRIEELAQVKADCMSNPEELLWRTTTAGIPELRNIFYYLKTLQYADRPDYEYIYAQLNQILDRELNKTVTKSISLSHNIHKDVGFTALPPLKTIDPLLSRRAQMAPVHLEVRCPLSPLPLMPTLFGNCEQRSEEQSRALFRSVDPLGLSFAHNCCPPPFPDSLNMSEKERARGFEGQHVLKIGEEHFKIMIDHEYYKICLLYTSPSPRD
eukprot:TRINITY_DN9396_c0_g2_i5.p1 TRINITY_DN9396_c0_g2~~TRINITY_DN9396_c0_g2_i5.p1  ORF type:complete len:227 (-),score=52.30 TRINITY_DN9396_c0_g2_i5:53-733(-)